MKNVAKRKEMKLGNFLAIILSDEFAATPSLIAKYAHNK